MLLIRQKERVTRSEVAVLRVLLNGPKRWKQLQNETGLSRQGLLNTINALIEQGWIDQNPRKERGVSYGRTPTTYEILSDPDVISQKIADSDLLRKGRYGHLKALVERVLKEEKNQYNQYLMLLSLFTSWSNADLKWVQNQMIWAAVALLGRDFDTFRDLRYILGQTYEMCLAYLFEIARKYPVAALALIDSAEDEDISDVLDEHYEHYDGCSLPSRHEVLAEALEPLRQHALPSFEDLRRGVRFTGKGTSFTKPGEYPTRTEKQIRKMLTFVNTRRTTVHRNSVL